MTRKLIVVRHGARLDSDDRSWQKTAKHPYNTPLSAQGHIDALHIANELMVNLSSTSSTVAVFASPFLRTIQTADYIARALATTVRVESGLHEWLPPHVHDQLPSLTSYSAICEIFDSLDLSYSAVGGPLTIESYDRMGDRSFMVANKILHLYTGNIILVTHGAPAQEIVSRLLGYDVNMPLPGEKFTLIQKDGSWTR